MTSTYEISEDDDADGNGRVDLWLCVHSTLHNKFRQKYFLPVPSCQSMALSLAEAERRVDLVSRA
jgi:hypothetical protein